MLPPRGPLQAGPVDLGRDPDAGLLGDGRREDAGGHQLAHNVPAREAVDAVLATARAAGADPVSEAVDREWGGYTGYFGDPDGFRWEIAWNPGEIGQFVLP